MRSFFNPAITLLNHLRFSYKIAFASVFFFIPVTAIIIVAGNDFLLDIKTHEKLKRSLSCSNALKTLYMHIPEHRGMMNARLHGDESFDKQIETIRHRIRDDIAIVDSVCNTHAFNPDTVTRWHEIKSSLQDVLSNADTLAAEKSFAFHTGLITDISGLLKAIGEQFRTSMSRTDLFEFYSIKILSDDIMTIAEHMGQVRGIGTGILAKRKVSAEEKNELIGNASMIKAWIHILHTDIQSLLVHSDDHIPGFRDKAESLHRSTATFLTLLDEQLIHGEVDVVDSGRFFQSATEHISLYFGLYDEIASALQTHIDRHLDEHTHRAFIAVSVLLVLLFLLFYFNTAFYVAFMQSLQKIKAGATQIGSGRYDTRIDLDTKDEMLIISVTFNQMAKDLQKNTAFLNSYKNAIDNSAIVSISDPNGNIVHINDKFSSVTGYSLSEVVGRNHRFLYDPETPEQFFDTLWNTITDKKIWQDIVKNRTKNGELFYADTTIVPIIDEKDRIVEFIAIRKDVTELVESEQRLVEQLYTDRLTGLDNRRKLLEDLQAEGNIYLILINIDRYREVNDYHGYATGDELLVAVKERLFAFAEKLTTGVYRLHADEFALLLDERNLTQPIPIMMESLHAVLTEEPYSVESGDYNLDVTLSAASKRYGLKTGTENLLINADLALRSARKTSKNYLIFDSSISLMEEYQNNLEWTRKLKEAIKEERIVPYYQPIINNETKSIEKYECLMRLIEKDGSVVSPFFFMETAKKAKLYTKLTRIMVQKSIEKFKNSDCEFSINLSADDILDDPTADFIKKCIAENPVSGQLIFEIVESEGIENFEEVSRFIQDVKSMGCRIAIDDFGTGYSNFEYLLKLHIDIIKIDGSLIKNIHQDRDAQSIVETVVDFAEKLNAQTVAEFVHSAEVAAKVEAMNIGFSQGYHFAEPQKDITCHTKQT